MSAPLTSASAFRQVDALTGRIAEVEQELDEWCHRCAAALHEVDELRTRNVDLGKWLDILVAERDRLRSELAIARALQSVTL